MRAGETCYYEADRGEKWFKTLIGHYPAEAGRTQAPALANLGLYFWYIAPWYDDKQLPHKEDEAYFVVAGQGRLCVSGVTRDVCEGDLVFVPRCTPHKFFTPYGEGLTLLIIFSPAYTGAVKAEAAGDNAPCVDEDYQRRSKEFVSQCIEKYKKRTGRDCSATS